MLACGPGSTAGQPHAFASFTWVKRYLETPTPRFQASSVGLGLTFFLCITVIWGSIKNAGAYASPKILIWLSRVRAQVSIFHKSIPVMPIYSQLSAIRGLPRKGIAAEFSRDPGSWRERRVGHGAPLQLEGEMRGPRRGLPKVLHRIRKEILKIERIPSEDRSPFLQKYPSPC